MADTKSARALGAREFLLLGLASVAVVVALVAFAALQFAPQGTARGGDSAALAVAAQRVATGDQTAVGALKSAVERLDARIGGAAGSTWPPLRAAAQSLLADAPAVVSAHRDAETIRAALPQLETTYNQIAATLGQSNAPAGEIYIAAGQLIRLERLRATLDRVLAGGDDAANAAAALQQEATTFTDNNRMLFRPPAGLGFTPLKNTDVEKLARQADGAFAPVAKTIGDLAAAAPKLIDARRQAARVQAGAPQLADSTAAAGHVTALQRDLQWAVFAAGGVALLALIVFALAFSAAVRRRDARLREQESRQQQAILHLLDEITSLANGDLTVDVTVTEDFTGAIADSINYTVQTLRGLVGTINQTSENLVASAANTQSIARRMSEASQRQAQEIAEVTNAITASSQQLETAAGRAEKLSAQAQTSVQTAHQGAETVGRTIRTMTALRDQIQDSSKRIKRLGESSQEIGNIIEFINDIAEQTNTLALNASIQAAMAGEAGRGFAVVAEEVQRLAERAGSATRQIESLIKTIQADTQEAVTSMERSTANVVAGAQSAEEAGKALGAIENSSQELARLIGEIASTVRAQSEQATRLAGTMRSIRQIAVQTSASADQTSRAVGELNLLSDQLRESVAGFTLPEIETPAERPEPAAAAS